MSLRHPLVTLLTVALAAMAISYLPTAHANQVGSVAEQIVHDNTIDGGGRLIFFVRSAVVSINASQVQAVEGTKFLSIDLTVKNVMNTTNMFRVSQLSLETTDGKRYSYLSTGLYGAFPSAYTIKIIGRDAVRGIMTWEIPENSTGRALYYEDILLVNLSSEKKPPDNVPRSEVLLTPNRDFSVTINAGFLLPFADSTEISKGPKLNITLIDNKFTHNIAPFGSSASGWKYYVVKLRLANIGQYKSSLSHDTFSIKDTDGVVISGVPISNKGFILQSDIVKPGSTIDLGVVFKVPEGKSEFMLLHYDPFLGMTPLVKAPVTYSKNQPLTTSTTTSSSEADASQPSNPAGSSTSINITDTTKLDTVESTIAPTIYAWAIGATVIAIILALILILRRNK